MTDQIILPARITAVDGTPASGAQITVFDEGTTTPREAFQDTGGTIAHSAVIQADAAGKPPAIYTNGTAGVKVVVTDANGASLFAFDPAPRLALGVSGADAVSFAPTTQLQATTVQQAIPQAAMLSSVSADDTSPGYLNGKLVAGTGVSLAEGEGGANETLTISVDVLDEDDFATNSASRAASQQSIAAYIDAQIAARTQRVVASCAFDGTQSDPIAVEANGINVASVTKNGTGDYTINFTTALPNANYSVIAMCYSFNFGGTNEMMGYHSPTARTTTSVRLVNRRRDGQTPDNELITVSVIAG